MNNLHSLLKGTMDSGQFMLATVTGRVGQWTLVSANGQQQRVRCAASCLLLPEVGDTVLVFDGENEQTSYVLAVLAKLAADNAELVLPGGAMLTTQKDKLAISATNLELSSRKTVTLSTPIFRISTMCVDLASDFMRAKVTSVESHFAKAHLVAGAITSRVGRLVQKARNYFVDVEELLETRADRQRTVVAGASDTHARHVSVMAEACVRIDGQKIDLG